MKRIILFLATNLAVVLVLSIVLRVLGLDRIVQANGIDVPSLLVFSFIVGFVAAIISLLMSKSMAKWSTGAQVIDTPRNDAEAWLLDTVRRLAQAAGVAMPEVAVYDGEPNAFATGAFKNSALVAVSTGVLQSMNKEEVDWDVHHGNGTQHLFEARGDVLFISLHEDPRVQYPGTGFANERGVGPGYYITVLVCQIVFGILASMVVAYFSRRREFRADAGSAKLLRSPQPMVHALTRLGGLEPGSLPPSFQASGISGSPSGLMALFASHPPIEERIAALQAMTV